MADGFNLDVDIMDALDFLDDLPKEVNQEVNKAIKVTAFKIQATAVKSISANPSQGITRNLYNSKKKGGGFRKRHTASKAGDAPNTDTGNLVNSIKTRKLPTVGGIDEFIIGSTLNYAAWLEFGTLDNELEARPWLQPAVDKVEPDHIERITKAVKKAIKDAEQ